jgi:hypothetical protein
MSVLGRINFWGAVACAAAGLLLQSCGPMNPKPSDAPGLAAASARCQGGASSDPGDGSSLQISNQTHFVISARVKDLAGQGNHNDPRTGTLVIRAVHGAGLEAISASTKITVTYKKESNKPQTHDPYPLTMTYQPDGSFTGGFRLMSTGTYDFDVKLSDGNDQDEKIIALVIPQ